MHHGQGTGHIDVLNGDLIREDTRVALCRCGQSANKPYCDATHRRIGFRSANPPEGQG
ncbi:MAG: CDGSH iron-sulfur domain-containing protein [Chloroflexi bacterium]|nr:CDGSH iron-sulfur domain-containing protein [Chloroflexota bacterium]